MSQRFLVSASCMMPFRTKSRNFSLSSADNPKAFPVRISWYTSCSLPCGTALPFMKPHSDSRTIQSSAIMANPECGSSSRHSAASSHRPLMRSSTMLIAASQSSQPSKASFQCRSVYRGDSLNGRLPFRSTLTFFSIPPLDSNSCRKLADGFHYAKDTFARRVLGIHLKECH
jgi:hypothetical protein